jgi:glycosyltransferase involved in cell wall biosynthesis
MVMLEHVFRMEDQFDVIHHHLDYLHFPVSRRQRAPNVTTLHGRLDLPDLVTLFREFREMPVISISNNQRCPLSRLNWLGTVYHGLPDNLYTFRSKPGNYLAFLGRIAPEKQVDHAIEIAKRTATPIKIAAKVDAVDRRYFESSIEPLISHPLVEYIGEIGEGDKDQFLGNALALLFPIDWPEPFGLVMIEAMACGTPVIAYRRGSVPEVIENGVTGFVVEGIKAAVKAVEKAPYLSRRRCRQEFERRFSVERMAKEYLKIYEKLIGAEEEPVLSMKIRKQRSATVQSSVKTGSLSGR